MKNPERLRKGNTTEDGPLSSSNIQLTGKFIDERHSSFTVTGELHAVSEVGEQLGWLGSALRPSPSACSIGLCVPEIKGFNAQSENDTANPTTEGTFHIGFNVKGLDIGLVRSVPGGTCWCSLFECPSLVKGYPIRRRPKPDTGLEISLGVMASIIRSDSVVQIDQKVWMKGFSSLAAISLLGGGVAVWHVILGDGENRVSYTDTRMDRIQAEMPEGFRLRTLETCRHIIGWCDDATDLCGKWPVQINGTTGSYSHVIILGHAIASLKATGSGLPRLPSSVVINRLYVEAGSFVVAGLNASANVKPQPIWLRKQKDYPNLLKWIKDQALIFYDVADSRAWLINGASALLHLVRLSLDRDENDLEQAFEWVFDPNALQSNWVGCTGRVAAIKTLRDMGNRGLPLYAKRIEMVNGNAVPVYETFESRVTDILHSLEILIDVQAEIANRDGFVVPQPRDMRKGVSGFDIVDIVGTKDPIYSRVHRFGADAAGWLELASAGQITTLFGKDLGNLILPQESNEICAQWMTVPTGSNYMAASASTVITLVKQMQEQGAKLAPGELVKNVVWMSSNKSPQPCICRNGRPLPEKCPSLPVQFLCSPSWWKPTSLLNTGLTPVDISTVQENGAFIFQNAPSFLSLHRSWSTASISDNPSLAASSTATTQGPSREMSASTSTRSTSLPSTISTTLPPAKRPNEESEDSVPFRLDFSRVKRRLIRRKQKP